MRDEDVTREHRVGVKFSTLVHTHINTAVAVNLSILITCYIYISSSHSLTHSLHSCTFLYSLTLFICCCLLFISIRLSKSVDDATTGGAVLLLMLAVVEVEFVLRPSAEANCCT